MSAPSQRKIQKLYNNWEDWRVDFKLRYDFGPESKIEFAKDVCALANFVYQNSGYSYLIIGIDNRRNIAGIDPADYEETRLQQIASSNSDPPPTFNVYYIPFQGVIIAVLVMRRNTAGPHQLVKNKMGVGFPIRRGPTTGRMTANELFQAMQTKARSVTRQRSDYEMLSPPARQQQLIVDCETVLAEFASTPESVERIDIAASGRFHRARSFLKIERTLNSRRWNLYLSVYSKDATKYDMLEYNRSISPLFRNIPLHRSIFVHLVHGKMARESSYSHDSIRVQVEPNITYLGLGEGANTTLDSYLAPKFYVTQIKSMDDIHRRIDIIINWILQHRELFESIRQSSRKRR